MAEYKFSKSHEWVSVEGNIVTIGITSYAQKELGDIVFIELPRIGEKFKQSGRFGTIESTKAASDLYCPVSGEVVAVNTELNKKPQLVNENPLAQGWMIRVKLENTAELNTLMNEVEYITFIAHEKH